MNMRHIFVAALEKRTPADRAAYLETACGDNAQLRQEIDALLLEHERLGSFLESPSPGLADTIRESVVRECAGDVVGPYTLGEQIGEGSFGMVFVADQERPVRRKVALKILKPGMDSRPVIARFEAERQVLALMEHPNIARILDGGETASGRPYFVMDLVRGLPITEYCDRHRLTLKQRLELFIVLCHAVQHAHQRGIIHRDLKPTNVLVAAQDHVPLVKVIDFGIAKALAQGLIDNAVLTNYPQALGTPMYMSPEQAEFNLLDLDTRTDVYSLGVILYELITGSTPFDAERLHKVGYDEMRRIIREEEPLRPSARISTLDATAPTLVRQAQSDPGRLSRHLRGELDWVVMKALEKDRGRRYETASALALDLQRYLADEPVQARPPSAGYRLRKFVRRRRGLVAAAGFVLLALLGGIVGTTWGLLRAEKKEAEAQAAAREERQARQDEAEQRRLAQESTRNALKEKGIAEAVQAFLQHDLLGQADIGEQADSIRALGGGFETIKNPTIKELLERAAAGLTEAKIEARFPGQPEVQAAILWTVGNSYLSIGASDKAVELLTRTSDIYRATLGDDDLSTLVALNDLARAYFHAGKWSRSLQMFEQVHHGFLARLGPDDQRSLLSLRNLALVYHYAGSPDEAIVLFEQIRDAQIKTPGADDPATLRTLKDLAASYREFGKLSLAARILEEVRAAQSKLVGPNHPDALATQYELALVYVDEGKLPQAIQLFQAVREEQVKQLGADHPMTLTTLSSLGDAYHRAGRLPQALELLEKVRNTQIEKLGVDHPETLTTTSHLASVYKDIGRMPQAIDLFQSALDGNVKQLGPEHPHTLLSLNNLATAYRESGKTSKAIELFEQVRVAMAKKFEPDDRRFLVMLNNLAGAYHDAGKVTQAIKLYEQVRDTQVKQLGADHPLVLTIMNNLAFAYEDAGRVLEAIDLLQHVCQVSAKKLDADHPSLLIALNNLGTAFDAAGKLDQALNQFRQAAAGMERLQFRHQYADRIVGSLIGTLERANRYAEAEEWRRKWLAVVKGPAGADTPAYATQLSGLGRNLVKQKKWTEAEGVLRHALLIRQKKEPDAWGTFNTQSLLGAAYLGQKKYGEAEPFLTGGFAGMKARRAKIAPAANVYLVEALQRLVEYYEATGKKDEAVRWRKELEAERTTNKSASQNPPR